VRVEVHNRCSDFESFRAASVKSLFNVEAGCNFDLVAELPVEAEPWSLGVIVGPSGSGKTSLGRQLFGPDAMWAPAWPGDRPLVDAIAPDSDFNDVTAALSAVGLGSVPAWLRPFPVLSNGEQFRANLARLVCEAPERVVVDEFTSVVDRQIAKVGALAFQKAWRRTPGQCVLLSCHFDVLDWLEPDWVFDTAKGEFLRGRGLWRRPRIELEVLETNWSAWPLFEPHHYLKLPRMPCSTCYVGLVDGEPVAHLAVSSKTPGGDARVAGRGGGDALSSTTSPSGTSTGRGGCGSGAG
jgi:energy-coupling factor transporter ATP-binding protein EcfA2